jgi:hypothetical protein
MRGPRNSKLYHTSVYDIPDYLRYSTYQGHCRLGSGATLFPRQSLIIVVVWFGRPRVMYNFWCMSTVKFVSAHATIAYREQQRCNSTNS